MTLHLVGETLDKGRGYYQAAAGKLVQLMRGIYVDADDDIDATVLRHAVRIAKYLYPRAYLSAASATLLAPSRDGRLFLSARRKQRTRIRALEIIQNQAPPQPSVSEAIVDDGMGEFRIAVSSIRQRFLEAFRMRSEHAASIDDGMRAAIAQRLMEEYGSAPKAADAAWNLARANDWVREGQLAERYLLHRPTAVSVRNEAALDLITAWHGTPLGHLIHDGFEWRWKPVEGGPQLIRQTTPGRLPPFISSLLPEGWLEQVLKNKDERAQLRSGKRYMSNITIVASAAELAVQPQDALAARLSQHTKDGVFTGRYEGPGRDHLEESFERNLARIYERADTPRLSGVQIKAPMYLDLNGALSAATGKPFTHILKPAGTGGYEALPVVEWVAMALGRAAGLDVPATALVAMPDGMPPALLVERFDIRAGDNDTRKLALDDLCSVLDQPPSAKYDGTMERVARAVRPLSTAPDEDMMIIIRRAVLAWLIADGDMHLKNLALLKIAAPEDRQFRNVRMAPLYDAVTTRVFPQLKHDRLALKLNGKDDRLRRSDFQSLARIAGLRASEADDCIDRMLQGLDRSAASITLPKSLRASKAGAKIIEEVLDISDARMRGLRK
ncbi:MAG: HipA domain-containing protein [Reyranellaceae bacterium]